MRPEFFNHAAPLSLALVLSASTALAEPMHGIAMYGDPALPPDFEHLPYVNPDAPQGGSVVSAEVGSFDSLNPYLQKGSVPWQLIQLTGEPLMGRSLDEPFSLYGLLAESIETGPNREWVQFVLRPEARFSDGSPVTVEDVIWSYETLGTQGHGRYATFWTKVESIEAIDDRTVRITFNTEDRELALLAGLRPILQRAQWEGVEFAETDGLTMIPITSGPYVVESFEAGRFVTLRRNPDYWGADIPFRRGTMNLDEVRYEFFGDENAAFEAFKTGEITIMRETNVARWSTSYDFPLVQDGTIELSVVPHQRPSGMTGFVMNTRDPLFADWRVRDAMIHAFNFEFINDTLTGGEQPRITSYFSNSPLAMPEGPATGRMLDFLEPYRDELLPGAIEGYALPVGDGTERNRDNTRAAIDQFEAAGWVIGEDGVMRNAAGEAMAFEILVETGATEVINIANIYVQSLDALGIDVTVTQVDSAQYRERTDQYDFDMTYYRRAVSLSPGNEQTLYWGSSMADTPGGRNLMGVRSPAVDGLITLLLTSESQDDFLAATQALDRVLTTGRYVIPFYQWPSALIAHDANLHFPDTIPIFGDWSGWQPDVWWYAAE